MTAPSLDLVAIARDVADGGSWSPGTGNGDEDRPDREPLAESGPASPVVATP